MSNLNLADPNAAEMLEEAERREELQQPFDAGNEKSVARKRKSAQERIADRDEALRAFMTHEQGRAWVAWLLGQCHINMFIEANNAIHLSRLEGERNIGVLVQNELVRLCPDDYVKMLRENADA